MYIDKSGKSVLNFPLLTYIWLLSYFLYYYHCVW